MSNNETRSEPTDKAAELLAAVRADAATRDTIAACELAIHAALEQYGCRLEVSVNFGRETRVMIHVLRKEGLA